MTTTIKITELTNIGGNLASSTVLPVVNMSGTPTTQKTVMANIANLVLAGAGGNYVAAATATTANTVITNAQPNITSVGNLTGLTVSNATGVVNFSNTANVTLGAVANLRITGGSNGQTLTTNGSGNLSWTTVSGGNGIPSGSNTQIQFNDVGVFGGNAGFTFDKTTGVLAAPFADVSGVANVEGGGATVATKSVLNVASTFGSDDANDPASAQAIRGLVTGANLTKTRNYVTGVTGQYLVTGTNASEFIKAGILGVVGDQTTTADGAVVAYLDGDGGLTTANAAYAVSMKNSTPNSGFNYGLDLQFINLNVAGTTTTFKQADIRFNNGVTLVANTAGNISINANVTVGNIIATNIGNIANINLDGSSSNVLYGNGVFAAVTGGANTGNVTFNDINIIGTGNLNLQPDSATSESLDIYLTAADDIHIAGSGNVILGTDEQANVAVLTNGNVAIQAGNVSGTQTWNFGTDGNLTLPDTTSVIANVSITLEANDTGNSTGLSLIGDAHANLYAHGNVTIVSDSSNTTPTWTFDTTGNLTLPGNIIGPAGANFTLYSNAATHEFIFGDDGTFYAPDNVVLGGNSIYIGPGANTLNGIEHEVFIASSNLFPYVQAVVNNISDQGSADWVALGAKGGDAGGQTSLGFTSSGFADANYTITGHGDGYVLVQSYALGQTLLGGGGNLVLATGNNGTTKDIIFGTGGFLSSNIFGRISDANNALELSRTNSNLSLSGGGGIIGDGNLYLYPDSGNLDGRLDIYLTTGPDIHIAGVGENLILGRDDTANVTVGVNGNVSIQATTGNAYTWTFDNTGNLNVPGNIVGPASANFTIYSNAAVHEFIFADDGTFYAPDNVVLGGNSIYIGPGANSLTGLEHAVLIASSNHFAYIQGVINNVSDNGSADWVAQGRLGSDEGGWADMGFTSGGFNDANYTITGPGDGYLFVESYAPGQLITGPKGGNLIIATGSQGTVSDIIFGTGGFLTGNIFGRISHANNSLELSRTGATITFPDATEQNTAWTGSVTTIANGNSNVNIATSNGNIVITSAGTNGWNFDSTGNLTIPGSSGGFIKTVANASIGIVAVDNGTNNPAQLLSMTNAGAATSIISAYATNATIQTNATGTLNTWQFDNAGNLTLPTGGQIIVSGGLVSSGASPAPTINGFSITNSVGISGNGNIAGNNISATGNVTAQGVGTNMVRRANTISGSNTAVTLDNLTALVGGTPKRLYIGAATSNMTMAGQSQTMSTGALAVSSWINVPIVTGTGNGFAMSGAITNDGDTAVLNVTDQGAGSGTWRVTGMIANTSANLYSVSIERLA